jgi:hypothetical protein
MEVASPLSFGPSAGTKRSSLACSSLVADDVDERVAKRRRYHGAPDVDSLSEDFSSHSLFFKTRPLGNKSIFSSIGGKRIATMCAEEFGVRLLLPLFVYIQRLEQSILIGIVSFLKLLLLRKLFAVQRVATLMSSRIGWSRNGRNERI